MLDHLKFLIIHITLIFRNKDMCGWRIKFKLKKYRNLLVQIDLTPWGNTRSQCLEIIHTKRGDIHSFCFKPVVTSTKLQAIAFVMGLLRQKLQMCIPHVCRRFLGMAICTHCRLFWGKCINFGFQCLRKFFSQASIQTPHVSLCRIFGTVTVHQSLVESLLEHGWSNNRSFLELSACQLQEFEKVFFAVQGFLKFVYQMVYMSKLMAKLAVIHLDNNSICVVREDMSKNDGRRMKEENTYDQGIPECSVMYWIGLSGCDKQGLAHAHTLILTSTRPLQLGLQEPIVLDYMSLTLVFFPIGNMILISLSFVFENSMSQIPCSFSLLQGVQNPVDLLVWTLLVVMWTLCRSGSWPFQIIPKLVQGNIMIFKYLTNFPRLGIISTPLDTVVMYWRGKIDKPPKNNTSEETWYDSALI
ncbi:hypothetical protein VP01_161g2 [Puccinia sorghi]|uniref:Uncharacterized protein n=1 Tax=Puccinia sorghi TaxID=27349 RepID=A0A0L6VH48_9BASI|nr:hypothetical protein VP01_161g2 [Puccinia sorghi]